MMVDKPEVISTVKARGGVTPRIVRYMLVFSLLLAVVSLIFVLAEAPKATQDDATTVTGPR